MEQRRGGASRYGHNALIYCTDVFDHRIRI
jgi:hypothetical protein